MAPLQNEVSIPPIAASYCNLDHISSLPLLECLELLDVWRNDTSCVKMCYHFHGSTKLLVRFLRILAKEVLQGLMATFYQNRKHLISKTSDYSFQRQYYVMNHQSYLYQIFVCLRPLTISFYTRLNTTSTDWWISSLSLTNQTAE